MRTPSVGGARPPRPSLAHAPRVATLALVSVVVGGLSLAAAWKDYSPAFPGLPCSDGWAGCLVGDKVVTPGMVLDGGQRPHPGDMRFSFFDLEPLPAMSPFQGLSPYSGQLAGSKAVAEAPPEQGEPSNAGTGSGDQDVAAVRTGGDETTAQAGSPDEDAAATEALLQQAARDREARATQGSTASSGSSTASSGRTVETPTSTARTTTPTTSTSTSSSASTSTSSAATLTPTTQPSTARTTTPTTTTTTTTPTTPTATTPTPTATTPPPVADVATPADNSCDDLVALEAPAMMGQLGVPRRKCLEARMSSEGSQTNKGKISRVLMADAEARRDQADWERLIKNHLENIDRSDPGLCFKYAIFLSRGGTGKANQVIRWSDYALENKQQWTGATYTKNVYALLKLKTQAANQLWQAAEKEFVESRNEEAEDRANKWRGTTKNYALEWLDYAKASSQDTKAPLAICVSAAGNKEFCEG